MMIGVILRTQNRQRQPDKVRQPFSVTEIFPQKGTPFDVIIAVPIAAANRFGRKLQQRHYQNDGEKSENQINPTNRRVRPEPLRPSLLRRFFFNHNRRFRLYLFHLNNCKMMII